LLHASGVEDGESVTTYADLSEYEYAQPEPGVLNVGWLGRESTYSTATPSPELLRALVRGARSLHHIFRGLHSCEICGKETDRTGVLVDASGAVRYWDPSIEERPAWLGTGEIRAAGEGGVVFAAPSLVVHYVLDHHYAPPLEFVVAVVRAFGDHTVATDSKRLDGSPPVQ